MIPVKFILIILSIQFTILSCNNTEQSSVAQNQDTIANVRLSELRDTAVRTLRNQSIPDETGDGELREIMKEYISRYNSDYNFDSTFNRGSGNFQFKLRHHCLKDSAIVVPGRYVAMYDLDRFITHNFESSLFLLKNKDTILNTKIDKANFLSFVESPVSEYGVLLPHPNIYLTENGIEIRYSLSIPLTDLGTGVAAMVGFDGSISFKDRF